MSVGYTDVSNVEYKRDTNEKKFNQFLPNGQCPIRDVLARLGSKWSILIMITLKTNGTMRFSDINHTIGDVSQRMLTVTLRSLEADGLIGRRVYAEVPPRVEYYLTERGDGLFPHIKALVDWAQTNMADIIADRDQNEITK